MADAVLTSIDRRQSGETPPLAALAGLMFLGMAWIALNQFRFHLGLNLDARSGLVHKGYLGAELFLVTMGFVTAQAYAARTAARGFHPAGFLFRRLARVYPLHLVTIALFGALAALAAAKGVRFDRWEVNLHGLVSNLLLIQAWGAEPTVSWNFPSWLISAEWFAYLAFPLTAWVSLKAWRWTAAAVVAPVLMFWAAFAICAAHGFLFSDMTAQVGALQTVPAFLFGAALFRLWRERDLAPGWGGVLASVAGLWIVSACLLRLTDIYIFPAFGALVYGLAETTKADRPTTLPVMSYLGRLSYALLLVYLPVDQLYFHVMSGIVGHPTGAAASVLLAGVFPTIFAAAVGAYHLVQQPAERWLAARNPFEPSASADARMV